MLTVSASRRFKTPWSKTPLNGTNEAELANKVKLYAWFWLWFIEKKMGKLLMIIFAHRSLFFYDSTVYTPPLVERPRPKIDKCEAFL